MKSLRALALAILAAFSFSACLQEEKIIKLNADGSGTVVETMVMSKEVVQQLQGFANGFGGLTGKPKADGAPASSPFQILDEDKLRDAADKMGDGVTFVSAKPVSTPAGEGFVATYAFTDINKLKVDQNPGDSVPGGNNPMMKMNKMKKEPVKFEFTKGAPASLTVKMPQPKSSDLTKDRPQKPAGANGDMAAMMMQQMFKDLKITLAIEVAGNIVETNAEYRDGSRVTLVDIDFNKVLADPEKFKALTQAQPKTLEEAKALVKGIDGIKADIQPTVTVKFK